MEKTDLVSDEESKTAPIEGVTSNYIDPQAEKKLLRKLDLHLIPLVMLLYLFSFLDRVNIGNARLYGMEEDLGLKGNQYQTAVSLLFVTYLLSEVPSNLALKKLRPNRWISFITTVWGIIATLTGITQNYAGLLVCRLILGAVEGGLFPGLAVYLTIFYGKHELALRIGYLFVSSALAGGFGGLLAYGIGHMDGVAGLRGWRWIMIIEGLPTFCLGIATWFLMPNDTRSAYFLTDEDRDLCRRRLDAEYGQTASAQEFSKKDMIKGFKDWKIWAFCFVQFGTDTMLYGYSTFLPTIIKGLGSWTTAEIQLLTIPCYFVGALAYMTMARVSDKVQKRGVFTIMFGVISIVGYAILASPVKTGIHYFATFLVACGLYVCVGLPLAWLPANNPRFGKRTTATGLQLTIGNSAGVMAPFLYPTSEAPRYVKGHVITLALIAFAMCIDGVLWFWFARENKRRDAVREDAIERLGLSEQEMMEMGDESPRYRYTI